MYRLIFERWWSESCYGGASSLNRENWILTMNPDYPTKSNRTQGKDGGKDAGWESVHRILEGEFKTRDEAISYLIEFESKSWLGKSIKMILDKYPESNYFSISERLPGRAIGMDEDRNTIKIDETVDGFIIHVAGNEYSPFLFSSDVDARTFAQTIKVYDMGTLPRPILP
jgi:hypothetical protein